MAHKVFDKDKVRRDIERARRKELRERLKELSVLIAAERAKKWERVKAVKLDCRAKREALRNACASRRESVKLEADDAIKLTKKQKRELQSTDRTIRKVDNEGRRMRSTAAERRQESDDEVRSNLSDDMVPVFDKVARYIKPGPRRTRTEAFLEWAEENPDAVLEAQQLAADKYLNELLAEEARYARSLRRSQKEAVPF